MLNQPDPDLQSWLNLDSAQQILNVRVEANSTGTEKFVLECKHILALIDKQFTKTLSTKLNYILVLRCLHLYLKFNWNVRIMRVQLT